MTSASGTRSSRFSTPAQSHKAPAHIGWRLSFRRMADLVRRPATSETRGPFEIDEVLGARSSEVQVVQVEKPRKLRERRRMVVHPQVGEHVVPAAVAGPGAHHQQSSTLPTPAVAAGGVAGGRALRTAFWRGQARRSEASHACSMDSTTSGPVEDVPLYRVPVARDAACPGVALASGERRSPAVRVDETDLALLALVVSGDESSPGVCCASLPAFKRARPPSR